MATKLQPTHETGITGNGDLSYNIQFCIAGDGIVMQRHIWHRDQLGEHTPPRIEGWINSPSRDLASWAPNARPVSA